MIKFTLSPKEVQKLNNDLTHYAKDKHKEIKKEILTTAVKIQIDAVNNVNRVSSNLAGSVRVELKDLEKLQVNVSAGGTVKSGYAPYVNFGTGEKVFRGTDFKFTPELKTYASNFKGTKKISGQYANAYLSRAFADNIEDLPERINRYLSKK